MCVTLYFSFCFHLYWEHSVPLLYSPAPSPHSRYKGISSLPPSLLPSLPPSFPPFLPLPSLLTLFSHHLQAISRPCTT